MQSAFVIVSVRYCLLLIFLSVKPFPFIRSIDVCSMLSRQIINIYDANVFPCKTLATMSRKLVSPWGEWTISFVQKEKKEDVNTHTHTHSRTYIYIYVCVCVSVSVSVSLSLSLSLYIYIYIYIYMSPLWCNA